MDATVVVDGPLSSIGRAATCCGGGVKGSSATGSTPVGCSGSHVGERARRCDSAVRMSGVSISTAPMPAQCTDFGMERWPPRHDGGPQL